jgi:flagellum-specific peptidoglycan hydrolase FlgJ
MENFNQDSRQPPLRGSFLRYPKPFDPTQPPPSDPPKRLPLPPSVRAIWERACNVWYGLERYQVALRYQFHRHTYGIFEDKKETKSLFLVKICIIAIFMFAIFYKDLQNIRKGSNFAGVSQNNKREKTSTPRKPSSATLVSFGQHVNDFAPATLSELHEQQVRAYIEQYSSVAIQEMNAYGIPASVSMAQGIIESRAGTSTLARRNNNQFGIKCFSRSCPKGHCSNFTDDHHKDFFRQYESPQASWREHSEFLMKNRYKNLLMCGNNYQAWARGLREFGYATDPNYDKKLIQVIEKYQLYKLNK